MYFCPILAEGSCTGHARERRRRGDAQAARGIPCRRPTRASRSVRQPSVAPRHESEDRSAHRVCALRRYTVTFSSISYRSWTAIEERAGRIKSRGRIMRFLRSKRDAKKLGELIGEINDSIQDKIVVSQASDTLYADADTILVARNPGNCARGHYCTWFSYARRISSDTWRKFQRPWKRSVVHVRPYTRSDI